MNKPGCELFQKFNFGYYQCWDQEGNLVTMDGCTYRVRDESMTGNLVSISGKRPTACSAIVSKDRINTRKYVEEFDRAIPGLIILLIGISILKKVFKN